MTNYIIVMNPWAEPMVDTTEAMFETREEAVSYLETTLGLDKLVNEDGQEVWYNSAERYTIEVTE